MKSTAGFRRALELLTPRERIVFEMKHYQGLKLRAIGEALGTIRRNGEEFSIPRDAQIARAIGRIIVSENSNNTMIVRCEEIESLAILYACDELDAPAREALQAHIALCPACAAIVSREGQMHQTIASVDQPADSLDRSGLLLAQCRSELAEALDDHQARANRPALARDFVARPHGGKCSAARWSIIRR